MLKTKTKYDPLLALLLMALAVIACGKPAPRSFGVSSFAFAPDGKRVVFANGEGATDDLYLMNTDGSNLTQLTRTEAQEDAPVFSPDGLRVAYISRPTNADKYQLFVMNSDGSGARSLTVGETDVRTPAFAPDGKHLIYTANPEDMSVTHEQGDQIFITTVEGGNTRQLTKNSYQNGNPVFSPDGSLVAFKRALTHRGRSMGGYTWDDWDIYVMNFDGTNERRLTNKEFNYTSIPRFTPDGQRIVFSADLSLYNIDSKGTRSLKSFATDLYFVDLRRPGELGKLSDNASAPPVDSSDNKPVSSQPTLSPDGARIAFICDRANAYDYEICAMNSDGSNLRVLTRTGSYNSTPDFAPDGNSILFRYDMERDNTFELWRVEADGTNARRLIGEMK
ncbi:MAG: PD40 domain-containing protein [Pyrinomonadaceae bacterium]|nr:PD40 domain-containing protein [Pyrinomonadaceae bacterium]